MIDCHLHSEYSSDSHQSLSGICQRALDLGLTHIAITEHLDFDHPDYMFLANFPLWREEMCALRAQFPDLTIAFGVEAGYTPDTAARVADVLAQYTWDFILRAVHVVDGIDPYNAVYFAGKTRHEAYESYLKAVLDAATAPGTYHSLAHMTYVAKRAPYVDAALRYDEFPALIDEILQAVIARGIALEINTSGYGNTGTSLPGEDILMRYRQLGGRLVTLGSDAHTPSCIGQYFREASSMLRRVGFETVAWFEGGQAQQMPLA